ncbi:terpene synthase-like sequence-1,8-cineole [Hibiscus trionum]|uniref:Terpene synthase-like sequence-1,8-cineole n=1 Tax=Hibiscus trionum TaxID=183268 RepID=A0A9W7HAP8_HIBTR|nr:terpene synthase-like sequence-1,8-cineole [Hibiscus trionum]
MALPLLSSVPITGFNTKHTKATNLNNSTVLRAPRFVTTTAIVSDQNVVSRRSANYHPSIWQYDYIQSLKSNYQDESFNEQATRLVGEVRMMLEKAVEPLEKLELIDTLQRLGLSLSFSERNREDFGGLLRQHGYKVTQGAFSSFQDEMGNFKASLCEDCKGLLSLYEASYLSVEDEGILDTAKEFASEQLERHLLQNKLDEHMRMAVEHALELPLHWRMSRLEARWFIDLYEKREERNPMLLQLAKLDFNIVQAVHQDDLRYASKWWRDTALAEKLSFARDRLMEDFLWSVGFMSDPQFGNIRRTVTKLIQLITTIDDVYDVYGTLDELELFTQAVDRWDINAMELLPQYMKICFLALFNSVNETGYDNLKEHGYHTIPFLKNAWADLCKAQLLEAKWFHSGYIPTFKEYIDNAWVSISGPVILSHACSLTLNSTTKDCLEHWKKHSNIIYCSSLIFRLADDLGTSVDELKRGDVPKSIQCYMQETGCSEVEAREYIRKLIDATWKKMNGEYLSMAHSTSSPPFIQIALNVARMAQCMYQYGDGHGVPQETKHRVLLLLVSSIP